MKHIAFFFILISFAGFGQSEEYKNMLKEYYNDFPTITPAEAKSKLNNTEVYFLDTRPKAEYYVSHLPNAMQVGFEKFNIETVQEIPKNAEIIVYCSIGARSQVIGEKLQKAGYTNVKNLYGGLFHWININYPLVNAKGKQTNQIHGYSKEWGKWIKNGSIVY